MPPRLDHVLSKHGGRRHVNLGPPISPPISPGGRHPQWLAFSCGPR